MTDNSLEKLPVMVFKAKVSGENKWVDVIIDGDYDGEYISSLSWAYNSRTRQLFRRKPGSGRNGKHESLTSIVMPPKEGYWVEHINGDYLDNRSANLRYVTPGEAMKKRDYSKFIGRGVTPMPPGKYSQYRGVSKFKVGRKPFRAMIVHKHLGLFADEIEAARAYDKAAKEKYGDNAILNFTDKETDNMWKRITAEEFERIKTLLADGFTAVQVAKITGRPPGSIRRMNQASDLDQYREVTRTERRKYKHGKSMPKVITGLPTQVIQQTVDLTEVNKKLDWLMEQIKLIPKRRKF